MKKRILNIIVIVLMIMLNINYGDAQNASDDCSTNDYAADVSQNEYYNDDLYIKVFLHILRDDAGYGGISEEKINSIIEKINSVYNPHNIFFNFCIDEINDYELLTTAKDMGDYEFRDYLTSHGYIMDNAINGYFGTSGNGHADPSNDSSNGYNIFYSNDSEITAAHELGHRLNLSHTFFNGCNELAPYQGGNGANSSSTGDFVSDTPADISHPDAGDCWSSSIGVDNNCKFVNPNGLVDDAGHLYKDIINSDGTGNLANNIMSYFGNCRNLITPGQNERIRKSKFKYEDAIQTVEKTLVENRDIHITTDQTWNNDVIINGDLYIDGVSFTIEGCKIEITPGHHIYVGRGSYFVVDNNAILDVNTDNNCDDPYVFDPDNPPLWGGISINYQSSSQGLTWIFISNNSNINNAIRGISSFANPEESNPVFIRISDSHFNGNLRALELVNTRGYKLIEGTTFDYVARPYLSEHISQIWFSDSKGMLNGCNVINNTSSTGDKFYGIELINSDVWIADTKVKGWQHGIYRSIGRGKVFSIGGDSEISYNKQNGLFCKRKYSTMNVYNSKFENNIKSGIYYFLDVDSKYFIVNNEFSGGEQGIEYYSLIDGNGLHPNVYGQYKGNIFNPGISYFDIYYNNDNPFENMGPIFLCNQMAHPENQIKTFGAILPVQGFVENENGTDKFFSAGNTFPTASQYNFYAAPPHNVLYYYKETIEYPDKHAGIYTQYIGNDAKCSDSSGSSGNGGPDLGTGDGDTSDEEEKYTDTKGEKDNTQDTLDTYLDGGNTDDVIDLIDNVTEETSDDVTETLTELGPWLSNEAAEEFIQQNDVFSEDQIVTVLSANPDVFMDNVVYDFVFGPNSSMSQSSKDILRNAISITTYRTLLVAKLQTLNLKMDEIISNALSKIVFTNDGNTDYDNLRLWLERIDDFSSKFDVADTYMDEGNYNQSITYLQNLSTNPNLSQEQLQDIDFSIQLNELLGNAYTEHRYKDNLTSGEISSLESIAYSGTIMARDKARAILEDFYNYVFEDEENLELRSQKHNNVTLKKASKEVSIYPNPNNGEFDISLTGFSSKFSIENVKILSLNAKVIFNKNFEAISSHVKIQLGNYPDGIYIYKVLDTSGKIHIGKFILSQK